MIIYKQNEKLPSLTLKITEDLIKEYANVSGDLNPLHIDKEFAKTTQFGSVIAHGMLTLYPIEKILEKFFGDIWSDNGKLSIRFKGAAYPGDILTASGFIKSEKIDHNFKTIISSVSLTRQTNEIIVSGTATISISIKGKTNAK